MAAQHWTYPWQETAQVLSAQHAQYDLSLEPRRRYFEARGVQVTPPLVFPIQPTTRDLTGYLDDLPEAPRRHFVILLQAGASALGIFEHGAAVATKSDKKYVVRGRGREILRQGSY